MFSGNNGRLCFVALSDALSTVGYNLDDNLFSGVIWHITFFLRLQYDKTHTVEPGYYNIGLNDTSPIASDILWYQLILLLTKTSEYSVRTMLVYYDTKYSAPIMTL
jgi:hypothetical protein